MNSNRPINKEEKSQRQEILSDTEFEAKSFTSKLLHRYIPPFKFHQEEKDSKTCSSQMKAMFSYNRQFFEAKTDDEKPTVIFSNEIPSCKRLDDTNYGAILNKK